MALSAERRETLLAYCRIDALEPGEDALLEGLYDAALGYLAQAGVSQPAAGSPRAAQYDLCVNYLVLDGYDRRDMTITGTIVVENPAFRRMLNQLKLTEPSVSESDTGASGIPEVCHG